MDYSIANEAEYLLKIEMTKVIHQILNPMNSLEMHIRLLTGDIDTLLRKLDDQFTLKNIERPKSLFKPSARVTRAIDTLQQIFNLNQNPAEEYNRLILSSSEVMALELELI